MFYSNCLELIKFDLSNTSYYVEVESGALLRNVVRSWKMIFGSRGKSWKKCVNPVNDIHIICRFFDTVRHPAMSTV